MELTETSGYAEYGLDGTALERLALLGDLTLSAGLNVTGVRDPRDVERIHFLDSLSLLQIEGVSAAQSLVDIGSGGGFPSLVLALALPATRVVAIESVAKKCAHIVRCADALGLTNIEVLCLRVEDYGRSQGLEAHDAAVSRALAALPVVCEYSLPLLSVGGLMAAMKGPISDQERTQAERALGILGADRLETVDVIPFVGAHGRLVCLARKVRPTPAEYPRRTGVAAKRSLGRV